MLVDIVEEYALPRGYRASVCRLATRWFVLVGHRSNPRADYQVHGPYDTQAVARVAARNMQAAGYADEEKSA